MKLTFRTAVVKTPAAALGLGWRGMEGRPGEANIKNGVEKLTTKPISILKYFDVLNALIERMASIKFLQELDRLIPQLAVHATYEKRKKRKNIKELHIT